VVDDIIGADIDIFPNRKILDLGGRPDVKTDDDGLRGGRQEDIGLGDGTGPLVQDLDFDILGGQLFGALAKASRVP